MSLLFQSKEHFSPGPGVDRLPVRSRLDLVIRDSGVIGFIQKHFQRADLIANLSNKNDWRESEVIEWPSDDPNCPWITYEASQASLKAIAEQEYPRLSVFIRFKYDMFEKHSMIIEGHEVTYEGPMPRDFNEETEQIEEISSALIQAMMVPKDEAQLLQKS